MENLMQWLRDIFAESSVAGSVLALSLVIALGIALGKIKIKGVSIGSTWILFVGIFLSHMGLNADSHCLHFAREIGLIFFVYSIGLQVGPGFFSSFKEGGVRLNAIALFMILFGVALAVGIYFATSLDMPTVVGILSGAVTNTPGLGAAQQTYADMKGEGADLISLGYAVAYPLGVLGAIASMMLLRRIFRINLDSERAILHSREGAGSSAKRLTFRVENPALFGMEISKIAELSKRHLVISRILRADSSVEIPTASSALRSGDSVLVVLESKDEAFVGAFIGRPVEMEWRKLDTKLVSRRILITRPNLNGKSLGKLGLFGGGAYNITRVNRAGIDLVAHPGLKLQMGDGVTVVGSADAVEGVEKLLGNSMKRLREPNLIPIFFGIFLGVLLGSVPFAFPGIPQPVKLGLAGGPLVVAILIGRFGYRINMVTYTTLSANLMLREMGISLFLASVGLGAGANFFSTLLGGGYVWIAYGALITMLPMLAAGAVARGVFKMDYFSICGMLSGASTNPPALAYSNAVAANDAPAVSYATVYPLSMFMRVLTAQMLILFFCS